MKGVVDRIENGIAVVETDGGMTEVPAPDGVQAGDVVNIERGAIVSVDRAEAEARRSRMQARLDRMLKKKQK